MLLRVVVAILIFAAVMMAFWGIRRLSATRSVGNAVRGRQPRLAIMDAAAIDTRRRLVLVRRDNVEHLLMIGGPSDVVIEQNIVRAAAPKESTRAPRRRLAGAGVPTGRAEPGYPAQRKPGKLARNWARPPRTGAPRTRRAGSLDRPIRAPSGADAARTPARAAVR